MKPLIVHAQARENFLLRSLPAEECHGLIGNMDRVRMEAEQVIYRPAAPIDYVYFPLTAMLSWVASGKTGERVEVGVVGWEGMVGIPELLGYSISPYGVEVELPGEVVRVRASHFRTLFARLKPLQGLLFRYTYTTMTQIAQACLCGRFHPVESRLCRWLLMAHDRTVGDEMKLTQDVLAGMIGARRPAVSMVLGTLQKAGLIRAGRGRITILDRKGLEGSACECYGIVRLAFDRFLGEATSAELHGDDSNRGHERIVHRS